MFTCRPGTVARDALTNSYRGGGHRVLGLIVDAIVGFRHGLAAELAVRYPGASGMFSDYPRSGMHPVLVDLQVK